MRIQDLLPRLIWIVVVIVTFFMGVSGCQQIGVAELPMYQEVGFDQVKPILQERCLPCHQGDLLGTKVPDFRTSADVYNPSRPTPLVVPGKPEESRMLQVIYLTEKTGQAMPPLGHGLTLEEKNLIGEWIRQGACWPDGEVLQSAAVADKRKG
ncbi:MAG: hypothetical protein KDN20_12970 [Verrucomicrobiae bacterium]|nr:hypothetical protein [Verrucomicrobiae bacterium]